MESGSLKGGIEPETNKFLDLSFSLVRDWDAVCNELE